MQSRILNTKMVKELDTLNKSRVVSSKALQSEIICFRQRFGKHETKVSSSGSEAADVRMFETHNPGFCFHRDGQFRQQSSETEPTPHGFILNIYPCIFSDGEIDPEKVISLHLLTVHCLEIPCAPQTKKLLSHTISKSLRDYELPDYKNSLPLYWLESHFAAQKVNKLKKENVKKLKLINKSVELLVGMVMTILSDINTPKYLKIIELANSKEKIIQMLNQPKTKKMFEVLKTAPVFTSLKNYAVTNNSMNSSTDFSHDNKNLVKIILPIKCFDAEFTIDQIRFKLLKEMKQEWKKCDLSSTVMNDSFRGKDIESMSSDRLIRKINFSEKAEFRNLSKTRNFDEKKTFYNFKSLDSPTLKMIMKHKLELSESKKDTLISETLRNLNNSQRIRVGNKVAQLKRKDTMHGISNKRVSVVDVIEQVLSKRSLEDLLSASFNESDEMYLRSFSGLSVVDSKLPNSKQQSENKPHYILPDHNFIQQYALPSDHLLENKSTILYATIKQDVIKKETHKKIQRFLAKN